MGKHPTKYQLQILQWVDGGTRDASKPYPEATLKSLQKGGYLRRSLAVGEPGWVITDLGREILKAASDD